MVNQKIKQAHIGYRLPDDKDAFKCTHYHYHELLSNGGGIVEREVWVKVCGSVNNCLINVKLDLVTNKSKYVP